MIEGYVGASGAGKSYLALKRFKVVLSPDAKDGEFLVSPIPGELPKAIGWMLQKGVREFLVDELEAYCMADRVGLPALIKSIAQRSRHFGVVFGFTSKRPAAVPLDLFASPTLYLFRVQMPVDAAVFRAWATAQELGTLPDRQYIYVERGQRAEGVRNT